jgi:mono/diheme cytochrome c family protein
MTRLSLLAAVLLLSQPAWAGDPARDAVLDAYAQQARQADPAFTGFSAERGQALYATRHPEAKPETPACAACHGDDPRQPGRNAKTGKPIEPMAVSANPKRFTSFDDTEKWFGRNCKEVLGRDCTARDKGDYITFLTSR